MLKCSIFLAVPVFLFLAFACTTNKALPDSGTEAADSFLARPRFLKPSFPPLDYVTLSWIRVAGASGYELEMAADPNFDSVEKSWTINGVSITILVNPDRPYWFRIRSFTTDSTSRWSAPIRIILDDKR